ncbi:hypothetical protein HYE82_03565 [Streptomyces sp. BR123]|uniref:hypothetical protein n=1 Tax=Streptomyces sp. BR123 TaxID=2749828 RepID=UPI0015C4C4A0|nr:hypothetical protein [Streptomyces sp. BR123]NXY93500.1 hypothetical protein [Streptomyces sp. BR123]
MPDISEILKNARRRQKSVFLCLAGDKVAELERLEKELAGLGDAWAPGSLAETDPRKKLAEKVAAARAAVQASETEFRFEALGDRDWSDLIAAHPAKEKGQAFDPETFAPALIATCAVDPVMSVDQVRELFDVLNHAQRDTLWQGAFDVNTEATGIPFSLNASGILDSLTGGK